MTLRNDIQVSLTYDNSIGVTLKCDLVCPRVDLAALLNKLDAEYTMHMGDETDQSEADDTMSGTDEPPTPGSLRTRRLSSLRDNIFCVAPFILHDSVDEMSVEFTVEGEAASLIAAAMCVLPAQCS